MNSTDIKEADELYARHKAEIDAMGISREFVQLWGEDTLCLSSFIGRMSAAGRLEDLDTLIGIFSKLMAAAGARLGRDAAQTLAFALMPPLGNAG